MSRSSFVGAVLVALALVAAVRGAPARADADAVRRIRARAGS